MTYEITGDLDLVRRVVVVVPRGGRLAQADLQEDSGNEERQRDDHCQRAEEIRSPGAATPTDRCNERDEQAREDSRRANEAVIPFATCCAHEWAEQSVRMHRRMERPRVRAELRDDDRDDEAERREDCPRAGAADRHRAGTASRGSLTRTTGSIRRSGSASWAAAIPSTSHVIGSSKNPL